MSQPLRKTGACHLLGDDIPLDEGLMAFKYAIERITDPAVLIPHLLEQIDPDFAARVRPGDLVVAGRNFACGKPHIQGFIAMLALDMGIVCASMSHKSLRRAVAVGLPVLQIGDHARELAQTGDRLDVDFASGAIRNLTRGTSLQGAPMSPILQGIVAEGGAAGRMRAWLASHPDLAPAA